MVDKQEQRYEMIQGSHRGKALFRAASRMCSIPNSIGLNLVDACSPELSRLDAVPGEDRALPVAWALDLFCEGLREFERSGGSLDDLEWLDSLVSGMEAEDQATVIEGGAAE